MPIKLPTINPRIVLQINPTLDSAISEKQKKLHDYSVFWEISRHKPEEWVYMINEIKREKRKDRLTAAASDTCGLPAMT